MIHSSLLRSLGTGKPSSISSVGHHPLPSLDSTSNPSWGTRTHRRRTSHPAVELLPTPHGEQELPTPWNLLHPEEGLPTPHGEQEHLMPALAENLAFASNPSWGTRPPSSPSSWVSPAPFQPLLGNNNTPPHRQITSSNPRHSSHSRTPPTPST